MDIIAFFTEMDEHMDSWEQQRLESYANAVINRASKDKTKVGEGKTTII